MMKLIKKEFVPCPYPLYAIFSDDVSEWSRLVVGYCNYTYQCEDESEQEFSDIDIITHQNFVLSSDSGGGGIDEIDDYFDNTFKGLRTDLTCTYDILHSEKEGEKT